MQGLEARIYQQKQFPEDFLPPWLCAYYKRWQWWVYNTTTQGQRHQYIMLNLQSQELGKLAQPRWQWALWKLVIAQIPGKKNLLKSHAEHNIYQDTVSCLHNKFPFCDKKSALCEHIISAYIIEFSTLLFCDKWCINIYHLQNFHVHQCWQIRNVAREVIVIQMSAWTPGPYITKEQLIYEMM